MRQLLMMLLTIIVQPFTGGCQQEAKLGRRRSRSLCR
jgi:hypothetical protein